MYYLRKEPYRKGLKNGESYITSDRAVYKSTRYSRFYRESFFGIGLKPRGMKLYTCKTLKRIKDIQKAVYDYCGETFDIYDENGKVEREDEE